MKLGEGAWVAVADGEKALLLENIGDGDNLHLRVRRKNQQDNPKTQDQAASRPGRFNDGPSAHRSAVDEADWHELEKERFADQLAEILYKQAYNKQFSSIVLIAAPAILGRLRQKLHSEVASRVVAEIDKDLTNHPIDEIEKLIAAIPADC